jgi:hypothetical protein
LKENFDRFTHDNFKEKEMADFRKIFFVLAGLLLVISSASAQTVSLACTAYVANQPILRQEGATEPAGDIIIQCQGTPVLAQTGPQTLTLYTSAGIASRTEGTATTNSTPTDAALLVNDIPATAAQGFIQNGALVFSGFLLPTGGGNNNAFSVRITNVRINANALASGSFVTGTILATFPVSNQAGLVLGAVQTSLSVSVTSPAPTLAQCQTQTAANESNLTVSELVQTAFKVQGNAGSNSVGQWYQNGVNTESQTIFTAPASWGNVIATPGQADAATRIRVNVSNVPAGVTVYLPVSVSTTSGTPSVVVGQLIATSSGDLGTYSPASGSTLSGVTGTNTTFIALTASGSVTYQVIQQNPAGIDSFKLPIYVAYTYTAPSTPNVGTVLVSATYAPTTALTSTQIPRFADTSVLTPLFTITACQTDLLFTFLTNQAGFDTGIEIANTSADPFGTANQNGTCTLNWYGTGPAAGTSTTTTSVSAGGYYVTSISTVAPGFQGYMIAVCNFQYGHGFAFITDGYGQPGKGLSQGYLASIIPTPGVNASGVRNAADASKATTTTTGEALNQ